MPFRGEFAYNEEQFVSRVHKEARLLMFEYIFTPS
jgi:hypothetical protein